MREFYAKYKGFFTNIIKYFLILLVFYIVVKYIFHYIAPFVLAFIFSLILEPIVKRLNKHLKLSRGISTTIVILALIAAILFLGTGIVSRLVQEAKDLMSNMPVYQEQVMKTYSDIKIKAEDYLYLVPDDIRNAMGNVTDSILNAIMSLLGSGMKTGSVNIVSKVPSGFMFIIVNILATFFLLKDKYEIESFVVKRMPMPFITVFKRIKFHALTALVGYLKAQLMLMCCTGIICITVLTIIGSRYSLLMGIIISMVDALPIFGSGFVLWPWAAMSLLSGNYQFAVGLIINYLMVILTRQFLEPKIVGEQIGIHPLVTLFSIYVGLKIFGVFGVIIGPITVITMKAIATMDKHETT
jgi:sporulation integral membrane protein YtvI